MALTRCAFLSYPVRTAIERAAQLMNTIQETSFAVGRFLVSPSTRQTDCGAYAATVSIRSGRGRGTHDRVLNFDARFTTREGARRHAIGQGLSWLDQHHSRLAVAS